MFIIVVIILGLGGKQATYYLGELTIPKATEAYIYAYIYIYNLASMCKICRYKFAWICMDTVLNTLRPRRNGRHFADDTVNRIFVNENVRISINFSLKFVPQGPINNIPALVQIMAISHYLNQWWFVYRRIYASLGLNELITNISICIRLFLLWLYAIILGGFYLIIAA